MGAALTAVLGVLALAGCTGPSTAGRFTDPQVTALVEAASAGDGARVRRPAAGVDLDSRGEHGYTPLLALVEAGDLVGVRTVLAAGADRTTAIDAGATAVHLAAGRERTDMLEMLLGLGSDPSTPNAVTGASPLRPAFHGYHADSARALIAGDTDVNLADRR
jgi:ankyrin repeat protein